MCESFYRLGVMYLGLWHSMLVQIIPFNAPYHTPSPPHQPFTEQSKHEGEIINSSIVALCQLQNTFRAVGESHS